MICTALRTTVKMPSAIETEMSLSLWKWSRVTQKSSVVLQCAYHFSKQSRPRWIAICL